MTSNFQRYISTTQEQEVPTNFWKNKRAKDAEKELSCDNKCRLYKTNVEDTTQIINSFPFMPVQNYHLLMRHDMVAKTLYKEIIRKNHPGIKPTKESNEP